MNAPFKNTDLYYGNLSHSDSPRYNSSLLANGGTDSSSSLFSNWNKIPQNKHNVLLTVKSKNTEVSSLSPLNNTGQSLDDMVNKIVEDDVRCPIDNFKNMTENSNNNASEKNFDCGQIWIGSNIPIPGNNQRNLTSTFNSNREFGFPNQGQINNSQVIQEASRASVDSYNTFDQLSKRMYIDANNNKLNNIAYLEVQNVDLFQNPQIAKEDRTTFGGETSTEEALKQLKYIFSNEPNFCDIAANHLQINKSKIVGSSIQTQLNQPTRSFIEKSNMSYITLPNLKSDEMPKNILTPHYKIADQFTMDSQLMHNNIENSYIGIDMNKTQATNHVSSAIPIFLQNYDVYKGYQMGLIDARRQNLVAKPLSHLQPHQPVLRQMQPQISDQYKNCVLSMLVNGARPQQEFYSDSINGIPIPQIRYASIQQPQFADMMGRCTPIVLKHPDMGLQPIINIQPLSLYNPMQTDQKHIRKSRWDLNYIIDNSFLQLSFLQKELDQSKLKLQLNNMDVGALNSPYMPQYPNQHVLDKLINQNVQDHAKISCLVAILKKINKQVLPSVILTALDRWVVIVQAIQAKRKEANRCIINLPPGTIFDDGELFGPTLEELVKCLRYIRTALWCVINTTDQNNP